jgi:hypothetical protein
VADSKVGIMIICANSLLSYSKQLNRLLGKEPLSLVYSAAACAGGLLALVYLRIYWGAFFVNPFPLLTPVQLLGYAANSFIGVILVFACGFVAGRFARAFLNKPEGLVRHEPETNRHAGIPVLSAPSRKFRRWLSSPEASKNTLIFATLLLIQLWAVMFFSSGPPQPPVVHASIALIPVSLLAVLAAWRVFDFTPFRIKALFLSFFILLISSVAQRATAQAGLVWNGGNKVITLVSPGQEAVYGYIGELGSRTYLLEEARSGRIAKRVVSVASSRVDSLKSPFWTPRPSTSLGRWWGGDDFQYGP